MFSLVKILFFSFLFLESPGWSCGQVPGPEGGRAGRRRQLRSHGQVCFRGFFYLKKPWKHSFNLCTLRFGQCLWSGGRDEKKIPDEKSANLSLKSVVQSLCSNEMVRMAAEGEEDEDKILARVRDIARRMNLATPEERWGFQLTLSTFDSNNILYRLTTLKLENALLLRVLF